MRRRTLAGITALCAGALFAVGGAAAVNAAPAPTAAAAAAPTAVPATTTTTLPLFGASLTVDVSTGPGGALTDVTINPAEGFTATKVRPNKVRFVNEDGTAKVQIVNKHGGQSVSAKAGQLTDLVGPGSWVGDVFGTGTMTTVKFEIAALPDGSPDITNITSSDATAQIGEVKHGSDDDRQRASVRILFTSGIQARSLKISVGIGTHDDESQAKLSVSLSSTRGQKLPVADVIGSQSWSGLLCDGTTTATIDYTVKADGTLSDVTATPATATIDTGEHGLSVRFSDHERVFIKVKSSEDGSMLRVSVFEKIRCDSADPIVNTPISEPPPGDEGDHHEGDHHDGDHHDGSHHSGGDDNGGGGQSGG